MSNLNVNAILVCEFVVVFDFDRHGLVGIDAGRFNVRRVRHEKVAVKVNGSHTCRRTHTHNRIKGHRLFHITSHVFNQPFAVQVRLS